MAKDFIYMLSPWRRYQQDMTQPGMVDDEPQAVAMRALECVYQQLAESAVSPSVSIAANAKHANKWYHKLSRRQHGQKIVVSVEHQGLYLWGGVGRGKTYLVDTFFDCVPGERKLREHFHHFMARIHRELAQLEGESDPLLRVAERLAADYRLICLDEFYVSDITDAMLLGTLLQALFAHSVILVTTSNIAPDDLYRNGLQRVRFLPAIAQIIEYCQVLCIDGGDDHRLRSLSQGDVFTVRQLIDHRFEQLAGPHSREGGGIWQVNGREVDFIARAGDVIWFTFAALCQSARASSDYIELARSYHTVLLSAVPVLDSEQGDSARRFIALIDELYDCRVKLVAEFSVPVAELYQGKQLAFEFQRTRSRLTEMQSGHYLALAHRPG